MRPFSELTRLVGRSRDLGLCALVLVHPQVVTHRGRCPGLATLWRQGAGGASCLDRYHACGVRGAKLNCGLQGYPWSIFRQNASFGQEELVQIPGRDSNPPHALTVTQALAEPQNRSGASTITPLGDVRGTVLGGLPIEKVSLLPYQVKGHDHCPDSHSGRHHRKVGGAGSAAYLCHVTRSWRSPPQGRLYSLMSSTTMS